MKQLTDHLFFGHSKTVLSVLMSLSIFLFGGQDVFETLSSHIFLFLGQLDLCKSVLLRLLLPTVLLLVLCT